MESGRGGTLSCNTTSYRLRVAHDSVLPGHALLLEFLRHVGDCGKNRIVGLLGTVEYLLDSRSSHEQNLYEQLQLPKTPFGGVRMEQRLWYIMRQM